MSESLLKPDVARAMAGGMSASTQHRLVKAKAFPEPITLSKTKKGRPARVAFLESEVRAWIADRIAAARGVKTENTAA